MNNNNIEVVTITQKIQKKLAIIVLIALVASTFLIFIFNTRINKNNYEKIITTTLIDIEKDIEQTSNINMLAQTAKIKEMVAFKLKNNNNASVTEINEYLRVLVRSNDLSEMSVVNKDNIVIYSSIDEYIDFDMDANEYTIAFDALNHGEIEIVQPVRPNAYSGEGQYAEYNKYAGVPLEDIGYLQVAVNSSQFQKQIDEKIVYIAQNRHIGQSGYVIISNGDDKVISNANGDTKFELSEIGLKINKDDRSGKSYKANVYGIEHLCITKFVEGYYITGVVPMDEVQSFRNRAAITNLIVLAIIFALMFLSINTSIRENIVSRIHNINSKLHKIIEGQLNTIVNEFSTKEFSELSNDINSTVETLKEYSEKEKENIKKELEFAKNIQMSSLPKTNTLASYNSIFEIDATIDTAKEVGGDFFDFYMLDDNHLVILIADVSGKGVPAAMFMMKCKTMLKNYVESGISLDNAFNKANEELCENNDADMFVTVWMGIIDLTTRHVIYVNAGHNLPLITNENGEFEYLNSHAGLVLTGMPGLKYKTQELDLKHGSMIYLYTDGVTEANNSKHNMYGEDRLKECLNNNKNGDFNNLLKAVKKDMDDFVEDAEQFDDITMLSVRII